MRLLGLAFTLLNDGVPLQDLLQAFAPIPDWREMPAPALQGWFARAFLMDRPAEWNPHNP